KDNISWHFPFPGANSTPWQLEGTIQALARRGFEDQVCVQNKTVVTNAFKGEDLNHYIPIFKRYNIPVLYNFKDEDMKWVQYRPAHDVPGREERHAGVGGSSGDRRGVGEDDGFRSDVARIHQHGASGWARHRRSP